MNPGPFNSRAPAPSPTIASFLLHSFRCSTQNIEFGKSPRVRHIVVAMCPRCLEIMLSGHQACVLAFCWVSKVPMAEDIGRFGAACGQEGLTELCLRVWGAAQGDAGGETFVNISRWFPLIQGLQMSGQVPPKPLRLTRQLPQDTSCTATPGPPGVLVTTAQGMPFWGVGSGRALGYYRGWRPLGQEVG